MQTYFDRRGNVAVLIAFGYSLSDARTNTVLCVCDDRLAIRRLSDQELRKEFIRTTVPAVDVMRRHKRVMGERGAEMEARRYMWLVQGEPLWKINLLDVLIALKAACGQVRSRQPVAVEAP